VKDRKKVAKDRFELARTSYRSWEKRLRAEARSDGSALYIDHMRRLGLQGKPGLMLDGTIRVMQAISAYASIDGISLVPFMNMQQYNPSEASDARYILTFDLFGKAFARVSADSKLSPPDLADLYNHPWYDYKVVGYRCLWISHPDWSRLTDVELEQLEGAVTADLRFDYCEDELSFWFDCGPDSSYLCVMLQDVLLL
jgi:hypothetical protein